MAARFGHRLRWGFVGALFAFWYVALMLDVGGGLPILLLVVAAAVLLYELIAVDRAAG